ncbi:TIGR04282 family arsenosugar biosynthesis glycosyltransferase [Leptospira sp. 2 VSF19]|uniref:TIGR04282 family arsenosugar biosynthesis glycosyltransferase n=1 Tax=Leptospira soteropolitanensis TaxID=2950025 RepID=A0AAW5VEJ8_9LEPT|nr:TIGR04282 family arsenosugar biosynthesis glycosyltransferase [Leptospira soteropolitanensis]MCW7493330.1 TIGR04282 family arsenosugar biosynthesis glycosyltransferase [Leptospira soteropolitanensis]MCW7501138.1 TIGR04282 family arsenosugar biosynthesis glycosyltransferase [Leptospira soteropolitanensis]MCW7523182.1 TIGR04282 family arsenosugar biosynthesis glycosyltransferase [Leptospira soteropolitanensis]MCW7527043.1 TIGR04282 family arsenosugar biosynthesis glycosyltransferase [Leptospir
MEKNTLIIFAKQPKLGKVKTRLASSVGEEKALGIYFELLEITKKITSAIDVQKIVYWDEFRDDSPNEFEFEYQKKVQETGDLGFKMEKAFQNEFKDGARKIIIIGTDCPFLTKEIIENAYSRLNDFDFVLGPALDGGYYLLGMKEYFPFVFRSIPWSTENVLSLTMNLIQKNNKTVTLLEELCDIDDINDFNLWKGSI